MGLLTRTIDEQARATGPGRRGSGRGRGFSLVEALAASMVLALASIALVGAVLASHAQLDSADGDGTAVQLARQLMEEISAKPFADPTDGNTVLDAVPKANRSLFVNIDDYNAYTDSTPSLPTLSLGTANVVTGGTYRRDVAVQYRNSPSGPAVAGGGDFALVTVKVTPPQGEAYVLSQLMARTPLTRYSP